MGFWIAPVLVLLLFAGCPQATPEPADPLLRAVNHPERPEADRARDADRKPVDVLRFFGVAPGQRIAELMAGRGWYTEILARVVGPNGKLYVQNNAYVVRLFADGPLGARLARLDRPNVVRLDRELEDPGLPKGELDAVLLFLFYHDTFWQNVDRAKMNRAVFESLRPGGVYGIVDHHAEPGSGARDVKTLHRIDRDLVVEEITSAGFLLAAESDLLRHPEDDRRKSVFDDAIRGRTDRFLLRFEKPE